MADIKLELRRSSNQKIRIRLLVTETFLINNILIKNIPIIYFGKVKNSTERKFANLDYLQAVHYVFQLSLVDWLSVLAYSICKDLTNTKIYLCFLKMKKKFTMVYGLGLVW
jgi:hypothetical protein